MDTLDFLAKRAPRMSDEQRVLAAAKLRIRLDPVGVADRNMIVIGFSIHALTAILVLVAWIHRSYAPIKSKNLVPITVMHITGIVWYWSACVTKGLVNMVGIWSECKVWAIWIRMSATYIFISLLVFRTLTLHRIFVLKKPMRGWGYFLPIIIIALTSLAFNLATQFISPDLTIKYLPQLEFCKYNTNFSYGCMAFSWLVWVIYTVYLILIRNIKSSFNEFRESLVIYWIGATNIIETVIFFVLMPTYPFSQKYRILSVAFDIFTTVLPIWVLLVYPVYQRLFNRYEYLEKWQQKLTDDGLTRVYQLQEGGERYSTTNYSRMEESGRYRGSDHNQGSHGTLSNATFTNETHSTGGYAHHGQTRPGFDYNNQDYMYK